MSHSERPVAAANRLVGGLWCTEVLAWLPDLVAGTLAPQHLAAVQAHVGACSVCAQFGAEYQQAIAWLRSGAVAPIDTDLDAFAAARAAASGAASGAAPGAGDGGGTAVSEAVSGAAPGGVIAGGTTGDAARRESGGDGAPARPVVAHEVSSARVGRAGGSGEIQELDAASRVAQSVTAALRKVNGGSRGD